MDVKGDYASTDIRYRGKNSVKKGRENIKFKTNTTKKKVSIVVNSNEKVEEVDGIKKYVVECSGNEEVKDKIIDSAMCSGDNGESLKGEKEKVSVKGGDDS